MLEKLFTSKNRVKILEYMFFHKNETYIREISRDLNISVSAVKREIDNLAFLGIIEINKNRITLNKKCNLLEELKNIFIKTDFVIYPLKEILKDKSIKYCLIFGSFARGDYKEGSDVDLFVIGNFKSFDMYKILKPIEEKIKREINPVVWTLDNLKKEKNKGFVKDVFSKKIIMIKGEENELRKIVE